MAMSHEQRLTHAQNVRAAVDAWAAAGFNVSDAARALNEPRKTVSDRIKDGRMMGVKPRVRVAAAVEAPTLPSRSLPIQEVVSYRKAAYEALAAHEAAKKWAAYDVRMDGPVAINWFGDPHVDDDGCNWPLLDEHLRIVRETTGMFGANIGDTGNNWGDKMARLWGDQDTSRGTMRDLARYFMLGTEEHVNWQGGQGVPWLVWIMGNHDSMDAGFAEWMRMLGGHVIPMYDWKAQFTLRFPNGRECRIDARHNFKGHSDWNTLHGLQKAAHKKAMAHLYVAGHTHNWAKHQEESASRGFVYWLVRARGYKHVDDYAELHGFDPQALGSSIVSVIDPDATTEAGFIECFADVERGADYLTWLRAKRGL